MDRPFLLPGFRFHPTDVELVMYYLKRKVMGKPICFDAILDLDLYRFAPWDLPEKSCLESRVLEWYFFCPRDRKYSNGSRINRATEIGYWKTTGKDRPVFYDSRIVGMKKTLVFHIGRAPRGERTDWVMHEYRLEDKDLADAGILQDVYVLCKIFQKSGPGPKNGEQYGAPFKEEDWNDDVVNNSVEYFNLADPDTPPLVLADDQSISMVKTMLVPGSTWWPPLEPIPCQTESSNSCKELLSLSEDDEIVSLLAIFRDEDSVLPNDNDNNMNQDSSNLDQSIVENAPCFDGYGIYNGLEDLSTGAELNTINQFQFPRNLEAEYVLDQTLLGDDLSYFELTDLEYPLGSPVEVNLSEHIPNDGLSSSDNDVNNLEGICNTVLSPDNGVEENANLGDEVDIHNRSAAALGEKAEEQGNEVAPLVPERGEENRASYSRLQNLLAYIPTRPASAAEVVVRHGHNLQRREFRRRAVGRALSHREFKYVFCLGVVSALVWLFLLVVGTLLGKYAWKLFLFFTHQI
ncbi:hypothetical protein HHK36_004250 [Tetracentron sinense]|uniref:NAC domain-containing protein n=1 Tax=Tetracentron sinense TaxID=13715 RepID=A0A835DT92_TETSI|nr:hypothetical protein HHK36_004250 [Tetracentron sinense]